MSQVRSNKLFSGSSAKRLALDTTNLEPSDTFKEDSGDEYEWSGTQWVATNTGGSAHVSGLASNGFLQSAGTYSSTDVLGYRVLVQGSADWAVTLKDGSALTIPFAAMIAGDVYPENLVSITVGTGGQALLYIPS